MNHMITLESREFSVFFYIYYTFYPFILIFPSSKKWKNWEQKEKGQDKTWDFVICQFLKIRLYFEKQFSSKRWLCLEICVQNNYSTSHVILFSFSINYENNTYLGLVGIYSHLLTHSFVYLFVNNLYHRTYKL